MSENQTYSVRKCIDTEKACQLIAKGGALDQLSDTFEQRDSQIDLLEKICTVFNEDKIGVFEAGTGIGKSFAYLIPSILWVSQNNERVIISTGTINLQQQIYEKDLPLAEKITGKKIKAVLMKGRQNFLCLRRFFEVSKENDLFNEEIEDIEKINEWAQKTETGNKSDLSFVPSDGLWQRINSESDACFGNRCPHKANCFVMKMKKQAADAQIIIVNHHLLFADIEMRENKSFEETAVLPPYSRLVFDEAHGMENAATSFFSEGFTRFRVLKQVRLLYRLRKGNQSGLYFAIDAISVEKTNLSDLTSKMALLEQHLTELDENARKVLGKNYTFRLCQNNSSICTDVLDSFRKIGTDLNGITKFMRDMIDNLAEEDKAHDKVWETKQVLYRIDSIALFCSNFNRWNENIDKVYWIENGTFIHFNETPINISNFLYQGIFEQMKSVVCTSATLSIASSFKFWLSRVGINYLDNERLELAQFASPFSYSSNVMFSVPTDAQSPDSMHFQAYIEDSLPKFIRASYGRTLVLFTSYDSLKHAYQACFSELKDDGFKLIKQGDDDRFKLLEQFKTDITSVLFATYSFWEGIDVPGESLSQVIIVKLPFGVPSDPVFASRCEDIERRGENSFMALSVPEAIIKFKQGFGRLMRRSDDYGVVTVLDKRLIEKRYGQFFMESIPKTKVTIDTTAEICKRIENFL